MSAALNWLLQLVNKIWDGVLAFLSSIVQFFVDLLVALLNLLVDAVFWATTFASHILPGVPALPFSGSVNMALLSVANYFFPVSELVASALFLATVYAAVGAYKLAKFFRGGG